MRAVLFVCALAWAFGANAQVSDANVRSWIASALEKKPVNSEAQAQSALSKAKDSAESFAAWKDLKECRDAGQSLDLELASAEHYLFIRAFAAEKGERDVESLPALYGSVKEKLGPVAQLLKTSDQPVSPPNKDVVRWGKLGVAAGLSDYVKFSSKQAKAPTGKVQQYKLALEGYYTNYTQGVPNPNCKVKRSG